MRNDDHLELAFQDVYNCFDNPGEAFRIIRGRMLNGRIIRSDGRSVTAVEFCSAILSYGKENLRVEVLARVLDSTPFRYTLPPESAVYSSRLPSMDFYEGPIAYEDL